MNDRELLELAARAAGMSGTCVDYADRLVFLEDGKPASVEWNPLTDDGDALRLACDLRFEVKPRWRFVEVHNGVEIIFEDCEDEPALRYAATRRAITRAAAELARAAAAGEKEASNV